MRCGLLVVGLAGLGCERERSISAHLAEANRSSDDSSLTSDKAPLFGERVADGSQLDLFANAEAKVFVLIFVSTDCPIANRYAPVLSRLYETYRARNVVFWLVYADPDESSEKILKHLHDYQHQIPAVRDPNHRLVRFCGVSRTPEAAVFAAGPTRQYRGRIDDRFTDYGKSREFAARQDLQESIEAILEGRTVVTPVTDVIGCHIPGVDG
jgi:peroxiredoxin